MFLRYLCATERLRDAMVSVGGIEALVARLTDEHIALRFLAARALINYLVKGEQSFLFVCARAAVGLCWQRDARKCWSLMQTP